MISLILYSTAGCHLCDLAEAQLRDARKIVHLDWQSLDIAESNALMELYSLRIPVVVEPISGSDLSWPFDQSQLHEWLVQVSQSPAAS